jgi:hypothetical protein
MHIAPLPRLFSTKNLTNWSFPPIDSPKFTRTSWRQECPAVYPGYPAVGEGSLTAALLL